MRRPFVTEPSCRWGSKVGVSAILAFKMVFGDMNDTVSYPTLSNSTEETLKFSNLMSPHAVRFSAGSEGSQNPAFS
jgi:hypothetical protein